MCNEDFHNLKSSTNVITVTKSSRIRWAGHVARMIYEKCMENFIEEYEGRRQLWRPRRRWEENIKTDLREIE